MIDNLNDAFAHLQEQMDTATSGRGSSSHGYWNGERIYELPELTDEAVFVMQSRKPDFVVQRPGVSYLERWIERRDDELSLFIHRFSGSDPSDPHDHPADSVSLCLEGEMLEQVFREGGELDFELPIYPGRVVVRRSTLLHRLELEPGAECTTLFVFRERTKPWGFVQDGEWIEHEEYKKREGWL